MSESHTPQRPLILGSTSRYRRELLERLGLPLQTARPEVDETPAPGEAPRPAGRVGAGRRPDPF
jgi:septum formation protein